MTAATRSRLRRLWFQIHKWIGLALALLVIPISLTGSALVWHDWLAERLNPERSAAAAPSLPPPAPPPAGRPGPGPAPRAGRAAQAGALCGRGSESSALRLRPGRETLCPPDRTTV